MKSERREVGRTRAALAAGAALAAMLLAAAGCESLSTSEDAIAVTPAETTLVGGRGSVVLTAAPANTNATARLFLPLTWTVSNPALGRIDTAGGTSAVYVGAGGRGSNPVLVRDQMQNEGVAVVYHDDD